MDSTTPEPKVIVPYRWSRLVSENAYPYPALSSSVQHGQGQQVNRKPDAVYYTSPSGRVLLSRKDVRRYLREMHSCKCYIDSNVLEDQNGVATFVKSFNFDPSLGCYLMPPPSVIGGGPSPSSPCLSWASQFPANVITRELESLVRMLRRQLVHKPDEVHRTLCDNDKENNNNSDEINRDWMFKKWLARINWDEVVISNSGRIYLTNLSSTQLKHLLYECVREGVVEPPMGVGLKSPPQVEPKTVGAKADKVKDERVDKVKSQGVGKVKVQEKPRAPTPPIEPSSTQKMISPSQPVSPPLPASVKGRPPKGSGAGKSSHRRRRKSLDYQSQLSRDRVARARRQANETPEQTKKRLATQREREARQLEEKRQKALERTATVVYRHEPKMDSVIVSPPEVDHHHHHHHHHHQQEVVNYASSVVSSSAATELTENGGHKVYYEIQPVVSNQGLLKSIIRKETRSIHPVVRTLAPRPQPSNPVRPVPLEPQAIQDFKQAMDRLIRSKSKNPVSVVPLDLSHKVKPESKDHESKVRESKASKSKASEYKVREPKASNSKVRESKASKPKAPESKASEPKSSEPKVREPKASKSKLSKSKVQEPKVPVRRASLSKMVEAPRTLKTSAEPEVEVKKAARRERRNSQSRIKRASETPEQREVRLEKKREYNKRYRIKRRLSQMQEEDDKLAKMNQNPKVGRGAPDNEDDNHKVAKPKKLKESFADEVVGAADHQQYDPFDFENPYSSHYN